MKVNIDSIPTGSDVYAVDEDGLLGKKIVTTPLTLEVGFAAKYWSDGGRCFYPLCTIFMWGGDAVSWATSQPYQNIYLNIGLVKDDKTIKIIRQKYLGNAYSYPPEDVSIMVPLSISYGSGSEQQYDAPTQHDKQQENSDGRKEY